MKVTDALKYTDRDLIEAILSSYFIVDYGFVSKVNDDGTIDVTHARKGVTTDGEVLPEYKTHGVEFLVFSCAEFSISVKPKKGDGVILLGLKDLVESVKGLTQAKEPKVFVHYDRATIKAVPLSLFNGESKITLTLEDGDAQLKTSGDVKVEALGNTEIKTTGNTEITSEGNAEFSAKGNTQVKAEGQLTLNSGGPLQFSGGALTFTATGALTLSGAGIANVTAGGLMNLTAGGMMTLMAGSNAETLGGLLADLGTILSSLTTTTPTGQGQVSPATVADLADWAGRVSSAFL